MKFAALFVAVVILALTTVSVMGQGCEDEGKHCFLYTSYCSASNEWMKHLCAKTCNLCPQGPPPVL